MVTTLNLTTRLNPHSLLEDTDPPDKHRHMNHQNDNENTTDATAPSQENPMRMKQVMD